MSAKDDVALNFVRTVGVRAWACASAALMTELRGSTTMITIETFTESLRAADPGAGAGAGTGDGCF